ncbi:hypothetical protein PX699_13415 [Sphingobium sp. H39-3-25]|uniref:hypothetical protein n=1 Tax=Sphingobium arseniciresistens TaxID=3030834 RepID=UPI0023B9980B|nr:hypothetical protein [Sphingobium arseniciresistens]
MPSKNFKRYRVLPTKTPVPVDPEFIDNFVQHGWREVEHMYGKNRAKRWAQVIGVAALREKRKGYLEGVR